MMTMTMTIMSTGSLRANQDHDDKWSKAKDSDSDKDDNHDAAGDDHDDTDDKNDTNLSGKVNDNDDL